MSLDCQTQSQDSLKSWNVSRPRNLGHASRSCLETRHLHAVDLQGFPPSYEPHWIHCSSWWISSSNYIQYYLLLRNKTCFSLDYIFSNLSTFYYTKTNRPHQQSKVASNQKVMVILQKETKWSWMNHSFTKSYWKAIVWLLFKMSHLWSTPHWQCWGETG